MQAKQISFEEMNERCKALIEMGFETHHEDSRVIHIGLENGRSNCPTLCEFDFSATRIEPEAIIHTAIIKAYEQGKKDGQWEIKTQFRDLMKIELD